MKYSWLPLGQVAPTDLTKPRLQLHRAVQVAAATADYLLPTAPDHSHASVLWSASERLLVTQPLHGDTSLRLALDLPTLRLALLDHGSRVADLELDGVTIEEAYRWVEGSLRTAGILADGTSIPRSDLDLGEGPGGGTIPFTAGRGEAFEELARWYGNAGLVLEAVHKTHTRASPVRCWPHHFDIAVLLPLDDLEGEAARSIGIGMTPGDESYAEPYFYVAPWPYPDEAVPLPPLESGRWHRERWTGAVLTGSEIVAAPDDQQESLVARFMEEAATHARALIIT